MQMLGPNNEKNVKVKMVSPRTRKDLGIPDCALYLFTISMAYSAAFMD
jgi:hypothetical protein